MGCGQKAAPPAGKADAQGAPASQQSTTGTGEQPGVVAQNPASSAASTVVPSATGTTPSSTTTDVKSGPVTLRFKFAQGDKFTYDQSTSMVMKGAAGKQTTLKQSAVSTLEVTSKTANGFKAKTTITNVKVDAGNDPKAVQLSQMVAKQAEGKTIESTFDELGQAKGGATGSQNPMASMMGGSAGTSNVGLMGVVLPKQAVKVGSVWTSTADLSQAFKAMSSFMKLKSGGMLTFKYTLKGIESSAGKTVADVDVTMSGKLVLGAVKPQPGQPSEMAMSMSGSGTARVEVATGAIIDVTQKLVNTMDMGKQKMVQQLDSTLRRKS